MIAGRQTQYALGSFGGIGIELLLQDFQEFGLLAQMAAFEFLAAAAGTAIVSSKPAKVHFLFFHSESTDPLQAAGQLFVRTQAAQALLISLFSYYTVLACYLGVHRERSALTGFRVVAVAVAGLDADAAESVVPPALIIAAFIIETDILVPAAPAIGGRAFPPGHLLAAVRAYGFILFGHYRLQRDSAKSLTARFAQRHGQA